MPSVFVSHGSPTLVVDDVPAHRFLRELGTTLPRPRAVLCVSAHWETDAPEVNASPAPETIHDFYGFPAALYRLRYPAPGNPALAGQVRAIAATGGVDVAIDESRGLDHGAWVPLMLMYPDADVPVIQVSIQSHWDPARHRALGEALRPLRDDGVLVLGSGGATHNLGEFRGQAVDTPPADYAVAFDAWLAERIAADDRDAVVDYRDRAPHAHRSHPGADHYLPLVVAMGAATPGVAGEKLHHSFTYGILSMAAYAWN